jgi:hypothetical protein
MQQSRHGPTRPPLGTMSRRVVDRVAGFRFVARAAARFDAAASVGRRPSADVRVPLVWADDVAARASANRLWRLVVGEPGRVDLLHVAGAQFIEPIAD